MQSESTMTSPCRFTGQGTGPLPCLTPFSTARSMPQRIEDFSHLRPGSQSSWSIAEVHFMEVIHQCWADQKWKQQRQGLTRMRVMIAALSDVWNSPEGSWNCWIALKESVAESWILSTIHLCWPKPYFSALYLQMTREVRQYLQNMCVQLCSYMATARWWDDALWGIRSFDWSAREIHGRNPMEKAPENPQNTKTIPIDFTLTPPGVSEIFMR